MALLVDYFRNLRRLRPDIFLGYTIKPNVYGSLAASALGIPVINNISGLGTTFIRKGPSRRLVEVLYRISLAPSKRVFFQNEDDRSLFVERQIVKNKQTELLPGSGVDLERFTPIAKPFSDQGASFRFLFIGRVLRDKGVCEYVNAARRLKAEGRNVNCAILGFLEAENRTAIDRMTIDQWITEGLIEYLGGTDDVRMHIASADCIVLPSYREGTSRTLLEAAAMGKPIIATDVPGCREVIDDGKNGLLCRVKDPDDLAQKMTELMNMPSPLRQSMGIAGRRKVEREFDEKIVIGRYLETIGQLLDTSVDGAKVGEATESSSERRGSHPSIPQTPQPPYVS